jgi:hypothetical protein
VEGNLDLALSEEARPGAARKLSGKETYRWNCGPLRVEPVCFGVKNLHAETPAEQPTFLVPGDGATAMSAHLLPGTRPF